MDNRFEELSNMFAVKLHDAAMKELHEGNYDLALELFKHFCINEYLEQKSNEREWKHQIGYNNITNPLNGCETNIVNVIKENEITLERGKIYDVEIKIFERG